MNCSSLTSFANRMSEAIAPYCETITPYLAPVMENCSWAAAQASNFFANICSNLWNSSAASSTGQAWNSFSTCVVENGTALGQKFAPITECFWSTFSR